MGVKLVNKSESSFDLKTDGILSPVVLEWLNSKSDSTRNVYRSAFKRYLEFTGMTPEELKEEIDQEFQRPPTERRTIERRLKAFYKWLTEEKGLSEKLGATYIGAIMSFYRYYNYRVNISIGRELKPTLKNRRVNLKIEDIRKLVTHAKTLRDRAIILTLFQSGMDVSTLCSLKVRDVWRGIQDGETPLRIELTRKKENVEYNTFLAPDAIEAIRAYLLERRRKEGELDLDSPLFVKEGAKRNKIEGITPQLIEKAFRELAVETGLVSKEEIKRNNWNPVRPHALRRAFADRLRVAGVNEQVIDYMLGHKLRYGGAYFGEAYTQYKNNMDKLQVFGSDEEVVNIKIQALEGRIEEQQLVIKTMKEKLNAIEELLHTLALYEGPAFIRRARQLGLSEEAKAVVQKIKGRQKA